MIELCTLAHQAKMKLFVTVILGLAGPKLSEQHARATASLINEIRPRFASALTLMLPYGSKRFTDLFGDPEWRPLSATEILEECKTLIEDINANGIIFHSNHASNYVPLRGTLQKDKEKMLRTLNTALEDSSLMRPEFLRRL